MIDRPRVFEDRPSVTTHSMISPRMAKAALGVLGRLCAAAFVLSVLPHSASAQGKLDARYEATLAGIPVGKGAWTIDISDDQFSAAASGGTLWLLRAFAVRSRSLAAQRRLTGRRV